MYIPDDTIAFMDNLIITKDAANYDLAMKFIDFMTSNNVEKKAEDGEEPEILEPSFANTYYVDYDAVFNSVYDELVDLSSTEFETDEGLYDLIYDYAIGIAFNNYYSRDELKGSILNNFSRAYIKTINKTFNNARV
jgi:spermidine/putrescine-binding protein